jgi:hypothetical protein
MSNLDVGNVFQYDVNSNVHTLLYGYCKTTKNENHEHQSAMNGFFYMMLVLMHIFSCACIVKKQKIKPLNVKP